MFIQKLATFMEFSPESYRLEFRVKSIPKTQAERKILLPKHMYCKTSICKIGINENR